MYKKYLQICSFLFCCSSSSFILCAQKIGQRQKAHGVKIIINITIDSTDEREKQRLRSFSMRDEACGALAQSLPSQAALQGGEPQLRHGDTQCSQLGLIGLQQIVMGLDTTEIVFRTSQTKTKPQLLYVDHQQ